MNENTNASAKVYDLLKSFSTAMFITVRAGGLTAARPMQVAHIESERGQIFFFTGKSGGLAEEVTAEPRVLLAFQNDNSAYLSLRGKASITDDRRRIEQLWKEPYKVWFPGGADDPEIALVSVDATDAEYWDNRGMNKVEYLFEAAKAYVKGEKPDIGGVDHHAKTKL